MQQSFQVCLESGDGSCTFRNCRHFRTAGAIMPKALDWKLILSPADRIVVDWRISEYELVDDNEASHVDKPVVLFSEFYMWSQSVFVANTMSNW